MYGAFQTLKERLITYPILAHPQLDRPFLLYADASTEGLGAVLQQKDDNGKERVISYASCTLKKYQQQYLITDLELLAIVWAMDHYRTYLLGKRFQVITDQQANVYTLTKRNTDAACNRRTRWVVMLSEYDYEAVYRKGRLHINADGMSRAPVVQICNEEPDSWDNET